MPKKKSRKKRIRYYNKDTLMLSCSECDKVLPSDCFGIHKASPDGFKYECKNCRKNDYNTNKKQISLKRKEYYSKNSEKKKAYQKEYYYNNSDYIKNQHKTYRSGNIDKIKKQRDKYYQNNKSKVIHNNKQYSLKKDIELGFGWRKFHDKTHDYIYRYELLPQQCSICGRETKIIAHHPSYESFDKRKEVVFVCNVCHQNIHYGNIDCIPPVDLVLLKNKKWGNKKKKKVNTKSGSEI